MSDAPLYEQIGCEHGWADDLGWTHCDLGSAYGYCAKEDCPIYESEASHE